MSEAQKREITGDLTFETVPGLMQESIAWMSNGTAELVLDLGGIGRIDSAGIALLLEWLELAKGRGIDLRVVNLPQRSSEFLEVNGLGQLFKQYTG